MPIVESEGSEAMKAILAVTAGLLLTRSAYAGQPNPQVLDAMHRVNSAYVEICLKDIRERFSVPRFDAYVTYDDSVNMYGTEGQKFQFLKCLSETFAFEPKVKR